MRRADDRRRAPCRRSRPEILLAQVGRGFAADPAGAPGRHMGEGRVGGAGGAFRGGVGWALGVAGRPRVPNRRLLGRLPRHPRPGPHPCADPARPQGRPQIPFLPGQVGFRVVTSGTAPDADHLRDAFTRFFVERGHTAVPSASLIPHDPSVLFTIAGMVPFKPFFLGDETPPWTRATSVQKCFRTIDIDIVGTTLRHCTFFEMLGNFSFGDYFKSDAIPFAWELITEVLGIDSDRLCVTIYETDDQAETIWRDAVGVAPDRIQRLGDDNFWKMGDTGPCGPSSEIFIDK